ncbi:5-oxoprolinase subunit B/C family protein [Acinetobacter rathckeae]|uniref:5-oxoprolinase subunit B/C family protein n=1 Tax=Acinetobacter rathckeae TaxID=2605272 RepID=UPI0018A2B3AA|nr:5-oxoprolinase/urea amidolyase family protein [Acinetobacter rathckeae]MBF7688975.1 5-oxoprolinase/urea amidolyase family protein [Acinetobacter rathckeae]MBF7696374.1 5-oxoprolinase/urea amidolyase family protein [Acinetobacter rathckeae]
MRFLSVSLDSFLIEFHDLLETTHFFRHLQRHHHPAIVDMIPAEKTILIQFSVFKTTQKQLIAWLSQQHVQHEHAVQGTEVVISVSYDGEDLVQVAELLGVTTQEVIQRHTQHEWKVAFIGFAPGFGYLNCEQRPFGSIPRLSTPRKRIVAGSVALAGEYTGVYPKDSPGGWQLIGRTDASMWDIHRDPPALLLPGNRVVFKDTKHVAQVSVPKHITRQDALQVSESFAPTHSVLKILNTGMQTLVQDRGRIGKFAVGVGVGGALDSGAMQDANQCVGNALNDAVLEILNGGFKAQVQVPIVMAITGAISTCVIEYADGTVAEVACGQAIALDAGDIIEIKRPQAGLRNYLAIRGGVLAEKVLASCSFDTLAELGPKPLSIGDEVAIGQAPKQAVSTQSVPLRILPQPKDTVVLDVVLGPRADWFEAKSLEILLNQLWQVSNDINRVGLRLQGEVALKRTQHQELPSEGTVTGALQIPPSGQPVLFMNDHPLTGGYPVIATVAKHHLDLVAQIPAGCLIKFNKVSEFMDINV